MKRILVCEDEAPIRDFVVINLERAGYEVVSAADGEEAERLFLEEEERLGKTPFDVALLDIMMPKKDGIELCRFLRGKSDTIGIIMLSAKSQEMDKVSSLMQGADDYVTKPFSPSELVARVDAIYRRVTISQPNEEQSEVLEAPPFVINARSRTVTKNDVIIDLTQVEYHILEFFIKNQNTALDRKTILKKIWGENYYGDEKIVDVNVRRLRMKIEDDPSSPTYIQTVWGFGYKWG